MKEKDQEQPKKDATSQNEVVGQLLRLAGTRPEVPEEVRLRVQSAVREHWKKSVQGTGYQRKLLVASGAAAAAVVVYFLVLQFISLRLPAQSPVGVVENISSTVFQTGNKNERTPRLLSKADVLLSETSLESAKSGRIMIQLIGGSTLRMDVQTRLLLISESSFVLEKGAVYIDSGRRNAHLILATPAGTLRNQGTQFEARVKEGTLRVRVRDGAVLLERNGSPRSVAAGNEISVTPKGTFTVNKVPGYGSHWEWISEIGPGFQLEGSSLIKFLEWIKQETGWNYEFADAALRKTADGIILHGSVSGLQPEEMPSAVLPVCGLQFSIHNGILRIQSAQTTSNDL